MFIAILSIIAITDYRTKKIPNAMVVALMPLAVVSVFMYPEVTGYSRLIGIVAASLPMLFITLIWPNSFGGGDIKLMAVVGTILGWQLTLFAFVIASLLGICQTITLFVLKKATMKDAIAFGPALCIGTITSFVAGDLVFSAILPII
jgi:prepilin signal peptidase PulO-like enzyme (type II secretory pathway)